MSKRLNRTLAITGAICAAHTAVHAADATDVEGRLKQLETTVQTLQQENTELKKELGWDTNRTAIVVKPAGKEPKLNLGGYLQMQGEAGRAPDSRYTGINDRFLIRRARITASGKFLEDFDFKIEADFGNNSISGKTGYSGQLTDGYINYNHFDFANVKVGQFKTPFGYEQLQPDTTILTIERSLSSDRLTSSRQIGFAIWGDFLQKRLSYSGGIFNGNGINNGFNDNDHYLYVGRVSGVPLDMKVAGQDLKWTVGVNGLTTHDSNNSLSGFNFDSTPASAAVDNIFVGSRTGFGVDTQVKFGLADVQFEYLRGHFAPTDALPASSFSSQGYQITGAYFVLPKYLQALVRFESFDPDTSVKGNSSDTWTFGANFYIKGNDLKLSLNYLLGNPAGGVADGQGRIMARAQLIF